MFFKLSSRPLVTTTGVKEWPEPATRMGRFCREAWIFVRSDAGKLLVAVRDNDVRCAYLGISPRRIQIALTVALAGVAGFVGFLFAHASGVVAPENTGFLFGTQLVIWVALGGRGSLLGPVFGTLAIDYLSASLSGDLPFIWQLVLGAAFVVIIILLPEGLAGLARRASATLFRSAIEARSPRVAVAAATARAVESRRRFSRSRTSRGRSAASRCSRISTSRSARANSSASSARMEREDDAHPVSERRR